MILERGATRTNSLKCHPARSDALAYGHGHALRHLGCTLAEQADTMGALARLKGDYDGVSRSGLPSSWESGQELIVRS